MNTRIENFSRRNFLKSGAGLTLALILPTARAANPGIAGPGIAGSGPPSTTTCAQSASCSSQNTWRWARAPTPAWRRWLPRNWTQTGRRSWSKARRPIYTADTVAAAEDRFLEFTEVWGAKYPAIVRLWENAWPEFVPFLQFDGACQVVCVSGRHFGG